MLQGEHSAILSTFIKLRFVILSIFEWPPKTGFTVHVCILQYCPKLEELTIKNCTLEFLQLHQLGEALPHLHTVNTERCHVKNRSSEESIHVIQSTNLGRREAKDLVVTLDR